MPEVRALLVHLLQVRRWDTAEILEWSNWRRLRNQLPPQAIASGDSPNSNLRKVEDARLRRSTKASGE